MDILSLLIFWNNKELAIDKSAADSAATAQSLNLNTFIDKLPGGELFKQNSQNVTTAYNTNAKEQVTKEKSKNPITNSIERAKARKNN